VIVFFLVTLAAAIILNLTRFGRYVYAVGGNMEAARAAGINVSFIQLAVYTISGLLCGLAGLVFTSRLGAAQAISGTGYELIAIAAVVVGGASLFGGRGTVGKTVVGTLIIQVLQNGLVMLNVPSPIQQIIIGMIIIAAVALDMFVGKER
jgi:ribose/xylose/arabinose/galactoside ABC-type transport system permease subunit